MLDKDNGTGFRPKEHNVTGSVYHIKPPSPLYYYSCCNNFWWCLNNLAKGIARDELPYVMSMLNNEVRSELHSILDWYIGIHHGFDLTTGKSSKYIKKYLPPEIYSQYSATYSGSNYDDIWKSIYIMCNLFHEIAIAVAAYYNFTYKQSDEDGMLKYIEMVKDEIKTKR